MPDGKFPEELRNFETRLQFISELFTNLFDPIDVMAHSIVYKLDISFLAYNDKLKKSKLGLSEEDPLKVLRKIK